MDYKEQEHGNDASDAQNTSLQMFDEQYLQEIVTHSNITDSKDQAVLSVQSLKRQNSDLSDNSDSKKQRTQEYLSEINNKKKEDTDELLNFVKALSSQITTNTADNYGTIGVDDSFNITEHGCSQNQILQQNSQEKSFDNPYNEMDRIESRTDEPYDEILPDVANGTGTTMNNAQNGIKDHDVGAFLTSDKAQEMQDNVSSWLKQTSLDKVMQHSLENLADESGTQDNAEPNLIMEQVILSLSPNESINLEGLGVSPTGPTVRDEEIVEPKLNMERMTLSGSLNNLVKFDHEILSTETIVKEPDLSNKLLGDELSRNTVQETKEVLDLDLTSPRFSREIENNFHIKPQVDKMETDYCISALTANDQPDQNEETINTNVYEEQMESISNKDNCNRIEINYCTMSSYSADESTVVDETMSSVPLVDEILSPRLDKYSDKLVNEESTGYDDSSFKPFKEMADREPTAFSACCPDKSANNCLELFCSTILDYQNYAIQVLSNEGNRKCIENDEESNLLPKEIEDISYDGDKGSETFPRHCEEISPTKHSSSHMSSVEDLSPIKRFLLSPSTLGKNASKYSSKPSAPFPQSNHVNEVIQVYLENHGRQNFSVQDVVNFVMEQFKSSLSYFDAIHSTRVFLRNALNAETLKMNNGKYVMKSNVVRTT